MIGGGPTACTPHVPQKVHRFKIILLYSMDWMDMGIVEHGRFILRPARRCTTWLMTCVRISHTAQKLCIMREMIMVMGSKATNESSCKELKRSVAIGGRPVLKQIYDIHE